MTAPTNQRALHWDAPRPPGREPEPGELLFEFMAGHTRVRCELRDHGPLGVEAQFFRNEEFFCSRRFDPRLDASRPSRELAIAWATEERRALEREAPTT